MKSSSHFQLKEYKKAKGLDYEKLQAFSLHTVLSPLLSRYFGLICAVMITWLVCEDLKIRATALSIEGRKMYAKRPGELGIQHDK